VESLIIQRLVRKPQLWLSSKGGSLREQVLRGGTWVVMGDALAQGSGFIRTVVLGHLIGPGDFGLLGIALLVQQWLECFTETGVSAALIQKKGDIAPYLDTAWTIQVMRGLVVGILVLLLAGPAGHLFDSPQAPAAIRCMAVTTLLWGLVNPGVVYLRRELRFAADVRWRLCSVVVNLVVAVAAGFWLRNAWALILAIVAGRLADCVTSYYFHPFRPRLRFSFSAARTLLGFGRWITVSNVLGYIELQFDSIAIGKLLGTVQLGFYQIAGQFTAPLARLGTHVNGILFPTLSSLDENRDRRRVFLSTLAAFGSVFVPVGAIVCLVAHPLVTIVMGSRWSPASPVLEGLVWATIARALTNCTSPLLLSAGHPRRFAESQIVKIVAIMALIYPSLRLYGIAGVAWCVAGCSVLSLGIQLFHAGRLAHATARELLRCFKGAAIGALPILAARLLALGRSLPATLILTALGLIGYAYVLKGLARTVLFGFASPLDEKPESTLVEVETATR
jgi:lipopolysaccharide exporter